MDGMVTKDVESLFGDQELRNRVPVEDRLEFHTTSHPFVL